MQRYEFENTTFIDILHERAGSGKIAYVFVENGGKVRRELTYAELHKSALSIASQIQKSQAPGSRVLLLFSSSYEFIKAFFGCLYAGVIAVPAYPPHPAMMNRMLPRVLTVIKEASANLVLSDTSVFKDLKSVRESIPELKTMSWMNTDQLENEEVSRWKNVVTDPSQIALIQFTSGSTGTPKGVMISHGNLVHNCWLLKSCGIGAEDRGVTWTPVYHDMGLIFGMLTPVFCEFPMIVLSPIDFLLKPARWLQEISDSRATITCAPNFAYDLSARKVTPEQCKSLDLSCLTAAVVSAEPVRADSLEKFAYKFEACGFNSNAFHPAYGMAETTLVITADETRMKKTVILEVDKEALEKNEVVPLIEQSDLKSRLVSSGQVIGDMEILIVDPEKGHVLPDGQVGELWISGPSVAKGYWNLEKETEKDFKAFTSDSGRGPFLRTGDLGCKMQNEIFITGRIKDMIIVRGKNYYPQDIEKTLELSDAPIRPGCVAAFAIDHQGEEKIVVIAEVEKRHKFNPESITNVLQLKLLNAVPGYDINRPIEFDGESAIKNMRKKVYEVNEVNLHAVVLIQAGSIFKTSSGKIQRRQVKEAFLKNQLKVVEYWDELNPLKSAA